MYDWATFGFFDDVHCRRQLHQRFTSHRKIKARLDSPRRRETASVRLPPNRYAHAALRAILTNETGGTTHSILRIASWIAEIGGSIKRKIPLGGIVTVIRDANRCVRFWVEIAVGTLSHQWAGYKNGPAKKAGRDGSICNSPHWAFRVAAV